MVRYALRCIYVPAYAFRFNVSLCDSTWTRLFCKFYCVNKAYITRTKRVWSMRVFTQITRRQNFDVDVKYADAALPV